MKCKYLVINKPKKKQINNPKKRYLWHKRLCTLEIKPTFKKGTIRNCCIELEDTGEKLIVPMRALRRIK